MDGERGRDPLDIESEGRVDEDVFDFLTEVHVSAFTEKEDFGINVLNIVTFLRLDWLR